MVEYCEFVFRANFSWSILHTRAAFGISFARTVSFPQENSKIKLCCSKFTAISRSCSKLMRYANIRASSAIKAFALAGTSILSTYSYSPGAPFKGLVGLVLFCLCLGRIRPFGLGCCCLLF